MPIRSTILTIALFFATSFSPFSAQANFDWIGLMEGPFSGHIPDCLVGRYQITETTVRMDLKRHPLGYLEGQLDIGIAPHTYKIRIDHKVYSQSSEYHFTLEREGYERRLTAPEDDEKLVFWPASGEMHPTQVTIAIDTQNPDGYLLMFKQRKLMGSESIACVGALKLAQ